MRLAILLMTLLVLPAGASASIAYTHEYLTDETPIGSAQAHVHDHGDRIDADPAAYAMDAPGTAFEELDFVEDHACRTDDYLLGDVHDKAGSVDPALESCDPDPDHPRFSLRGFLSAVRDDRRAFEDEMERRIDRMLDRLDYVIGIFF